MKTVEENRRDWLEALIAERGSIAELNIQLERDRTDATLSQIKNQSPHHKTGKPRTMGSDVARDIEVKLGLERGSLDYPIVRRTTHGADHQTLLVQEPAAPAYVAKVKWPFKSIKESDWLSIPEQTREIIEQQVKSLVPMFDVNEKAA